MEITWIPLNAFLLCLRLFDLFIKTLILTVLACIIMKVFFVIFCVYTLIILSLWYTFVLSFLTTLFGLSVQEGWTDLEADFVMRVLYLPVSSHKKAGLYCAEAMLQLGLAL